MSDKSIIDQYQQMGSSDERFSFSPKTRRGKANIALLLAAACLAVFIMTTISFIANMF